MGLNLDKQEKPRYLWTCAWGQQGKFTRKYVVVQSKAKLSAVDCSPHCPSLITASGSHKKVL